MAALSVEGVSLDNGSDGDGLSTTDSQHPQLDFSELDQQLLEGLDDVEYNIPPVEQQPTLESILQDFDEQEFSEDEAVSPHQGCLQNPGETVSLNSKESSDTRSRSSSDRRKKRHDAAQKNRQGSILRHVLLKGVSSQINSAAERVNAGYPTAIAVAHLVAIGTSHGLVMVFDPSQALKWCLGDPNSAGPQSGAVASLGFNVESTRLLAGFAKGQILMYDVTNGKLLRTITDAHPPATAVLQVKFTDLPSLALCSDSGGSVFELNFKRTIGVRGCDSRCLFSGSRGEVCTIEPLRLSQYSLHPLRDVVMVAMATLSKVIVVTIRPRMKVLFTYPLRCDPTTLPLVTWQFVIIQVADSSRVIDPVLAFARESTVNFFQVTIGLRDKILFVPLQKMKLPYVILNLQWFNTLTLAALDVHEQMHLIDVRSQEELEVLDLSDAKLVYSSSHFKGLATGGNVSKALALAGQHACYCTVVTFGNQIFVLGTRSVHMMLIRTWSERIDHLVKQERHIDALSLGLEFYEDRGKALIGLKGSKEAKKQIIKDKLIDILVNFLERVVLSKMSNNSLGDAHVEFFVEAVPASVSYCMSLDRIDLLFGKVYDVFSVNPVSHALYLESLEPHILDDRLKDIPLTITKEFVVHYEKKGYFLALEACIVHMAVSAIDIHQVMKLSWTHGMYDAIICIYNRGMMDYTTPIEELMTELHSALLTGKQLTEGQIVLGNKLLVYISCCLAGRAYPIGEINKDQIPRMKHEVLKCLTTLHTKDASDSEKAYPYLRTLLQFDTREFLNVLALAFEEPEFTSELGLRQKQRLVDILLQVVVRGEGFLPSQVGALFTFLARQMARHEQTICVDRMLFEQVVEYLTNVGDTSRHEERQQAVLELLEAGDLQDYKEERLLELAEKAEFYRVCELLYDKRGEHDKILSCYLRDPARKPQVFSYLRNLFLLEQPAVSVIEQQIAINIQELVDIDSRKIAQLIVTHIPHVIPKIISELERKPKLLYNLLQGLFDYRESQSASVQAKDNFNFEPCTHERYIELMCEYDPRKVYGYIKAAEGYRLEKILEICQSHNLTQATAYLLERTGDVHGAFTLMLKTLQDKIKEVLEELKKDISDKALVWTQLNGLVLILVQLCQRNSGNLSEKGREKLWFPLLEELLHLQRDLKSSDMTEHFQACQELTRHTLNGMMSYIALPAIIEIVMKEPSYSGGKFGDIKDLLLGMLETYNYEVTLLTTTRRLFHSDLHSQLSQKLKVSNQSYVVSKNQCSLCKQYFTNVGDQDQVVVFRCGHLYHSQCLQSVTRQAADNSFQCYACCQHG